MSTDRKRRLLRYLKRLQSRDLSLADSMIPLGSCTMKLNAAAEMLPDHVARASPRCTRSPRSDRRGIPHSSSSSNTGWRTSRVRRGQPPAECRSQGEYAGLMVHQGLPRSARRLANQRLRDPALGPRNQPRQRGGGGHERGPREVRIADRRHRPRRPPPTNRRNARSPRRNHGHLPLDPRSFETGIRNDVRSRARREADMVYMDGANMNAQVGLTARRTWARTSATSTCTRPSAFPTAEVVPAWARSA